MIGAGAAVEFVELAEVAEDCEAERRFEPVPSPQRGLAGGGAASLRTGMRACSHPTYRAVRRFDLEKDTKFRN